jgi:hypothetical protein
VRILRACIVCRKKAISDLMHFGGHVSRIACRTNANTADPSHGYRTNANTADPSHGYRTNANTADPSHGYRTNANTADPSHGYRTNANTADPSHARGTIWGTGGCDLGLQSLLLLGHCHAANRRSDATPLRKVPALVQPFPPHAPCPRYVLHHRHDVQLMYALQRLCRSIRMPSASVAAGRIESL